VGGPAGHGDDFDGVSLVQPFTALGGETAGEESILVAKADVDYVLRNRLTGVTNPARLDEPGERLASER
jgi:hypothetical protein